MHNSKITIIIDIILTGLLAVLLFVAAIKNLGEPYNELYFIISFICGILANFSIEKLENFKED